MTPWTAVKWLVIVAGVLVAVWLIRTVGRTPPPPRIVTVHDTLRVQDTLWLTKTRVKHDTQYVERIATARPETVTVVMMPRLFGVTELRVGKTGDSTTAYSFTATASGNSVVIQPQLTQWYTPGPLKGITVTPAGPNAEFWPPNSDGCHIGFIRWCPSRGAMLLGGLIVGAVAVEGLHVAAGRP